jgi:tRNA A37 threonylcarbamoyladenosine dehydratase
MSEEIQGDGTGAEVVRVRLGKPKAEGSGGSEGSSRAPARLEEGSPELEKARLHRRFDRMARLVGDDAIRGLRSAHVMVMGMGGVGSWAAESLCRAGVGRISVVDFDLICVTNGNRQLHAMKGTTGRPKVDVMAERLRLINPSCEVNSHAQFYDADTSDELLADAPTLIVDAIDNLTAKTHLIARARELHIPLVVSGGASGRLDPTQIRESDMTEVSGDPFIAQARKILRKRHGFPSADTGAWGVPVIHSLEAAAMPRDLEYDEGGGHRCVCPQGNNGMHSCEQRSVIYGTAGFVTGAFGLACTAAAVRLLVHGVD